MPLLHKTLKILKRELDKETISVEEHEKRIDSLIESIEENKKKIKDLKLRLAEKKNG